MSSFPYLPSFLHWASLCIPPFLMPSLGSFGRWGKEEVVKTTLVNRVGPDSWEGGNNLPVCFWETSCFCSRLQKKPMVLSLFFASLEKFLSCSEVMKSLAFSLLYQQQVLISLFVWFCLLKWKLERGSLGFSSVCFPPRVPPALSQRGLHRNCCTTTGPKQPFISSSVLRDALFRSINMLGSLCAQTRHKQFR